MPRPDPILRALANYRSRLSTVKLFAASAATGVAIDNLAQHQETQLNERVPFPEVLPHVKLGVLGSTRGTSSKPIIDAINARTLRASIECIVSNNPAAYILMRAQDNSIPGIYVSQKKDDGTKKTREELFDQISDIFTNFKVELILCIGFNKIIPDTFVDQWAGKIYNVHPSLLTKHAGKFDLDVHKDVLQSGDLESGATVHIVTKEVDGGPIVMQLRCPVLPGDTPEELKKRVQVLEGEAFEMAITEFAKQKRTTEYHAQLDRAANEVMERVMVRNCPSF